MLAICFFPQSLFHMLRLEFFHRELQAVLCSYGIVDKLRISKLQAMTLPWLLCFFFGCLFGHFLDELFDVFGFPVNNQVCVFFWFDREVCFVG